MAVSNDKSAHLHSHFTTLHFIYERGLHKVIFDLGLTSFKLDILYLWLVTK